MAKFCGNCGAELNESDKFCPKCGAASSNNAAQQGNVIEQSTPSSFAKPEGYTESILALILGALGGWFGLLFGIIGLSTNKSHNNGVTTRSILGIVLFILWKLILAAL